MKVQGLDGREYNINLSYEANRKKKGGSKLHQRARKLIASLFPYHYIVEELTLPGSRGISKKPLIADFFIPEKRIVVEVHGEQHYNDNRFFYEDKREFFAAKARDNKKKEWCSTNSIQLIELPYNESDNEWRQRLTEY